MNNSGLNKAFTTREQNIAFRLSGRIKNFTGRSPAVIKVKINESMVTVQLKWFLTAIEKSFLENFHDQFLVTVMRSELVEVAKGNLVRALSEVYNREVKILEVNEELLQEKLNIHVQVLDSAS